MVAERGCLDGLKQPKLGPVRRIGEGCQQGMACFDTASVIELVNFLEGVKLYFKQVDMLCGSDKEIEDER